MLEPGWDIIVGFVSYVYEFFSFSFNGGAYVVFWFRSPILWITQDQGSFNSL